MRDRKKVLVLDDESIVCERLKPALEKVGFQVETCTESQAAIDRVAAERFDVVVSDIKMRGPDGLDVLHFVKEHSPSTQVVIITGFATIDLAREAMKRGAADFIAKPFKIKELRDLLVRLTQTGGPAAG
jgi:DNA-binding NtrC family response regulator